MASEHRQKEKIVLNFSIDLLRFRPLRALVRWGGFPYLFQAVALAVFVGFAWISWGRFAPEGVADKLFAKTHLVQLVIWGLWWPGMIWAAVVLGRAWCAVCPLELVASLSERLGRWLGIRQRDLGRRLSSGVLILVLYAAIQLLVAGVHLHRVPAYTSIFLLVLLGSAAVVGFLWRHRAFCRGFCPVGLLLGTYGRGGMLAVRNGDSGSCASCTGKGCVLACNRDRWDGRSCPSLLNPAQLDTSQDCLVCGQCLKACEPGVMQLRLRSLFHPGDARETLAPWPVVLFVMMVSGFVTYEVCTEWSAAAAAFKWVPKQLALASGIPGAEGWLKGIWTLFVFPAVLWLILGALTMATGSARSLAEAWRRLALPVVVVVAAGHMAKGLAKVASWGGFLPGALGDPGGKATAMAITVGDLDLPQAILIKTWVGGVGLALIVIATVLALREARLAEATPGRRLVVPIVTVSIAYAVVLAGWIG